MKDYENFKKDGKQNMSLASSFNNVIHKPMWDVKVKHVCPPYLHMLLGIVKKCGPFLPITFKITITCTFFSFFLYIGCSVV